MKRLLYGILAVAALYVAVAALAAAFQERLLYFPRYDMQPASEYGLEGFSDITLDASDGERVALWYRAPSEGYPLILFFHGNGGHLGYRSVYFQALSDRGFGILATSYRGYGSSTGTPSEQSMYEDATLAYKLATGKLGIPSSRIMIYGESLGTGVSTYLASKQEVGAVALQSPFTSVAERAAEIYFFLPVKLLLKHHYNSLSRITEIDAPLLILHGEEDRIVPAAHGKRLLAAASEPKEAIFYENYGHNDMPPLEMAKNVEVFAIKHELISIKP